MKNFVIASFALASVLLTSAAVQATPVALYDPATGGITFEMVEDLVGLRLNGPAFIDGQATTLDGAAEGGFGVVNEQPTFVEWGNLTGLNFVSSFAGNVLPTQLDQPTIDADYEFLYRSSSAPGVDVVGTITVVPEPTAITLAGLSMLGLVARRRRS